MCQENDCKKWAQNIHPTTFSSRHLAQGPSEGQPCREVGTEKGAINFPSDFQGSSESLHLISLRATLQIRVDKQPKRDKVLVAYIGQALCPGRWIPPLLAKKA